MSYTIPFTDDSVKQEICGKKFVYGFRKVNDNVFYPKDEISFDDEKWRVEDGVLQLINEQNSVKDRINAVEVLKGVPCLSGEGSHAVDSARSVLYERKALGDSISIVVSSHKDYAEKTIPRLVRSLRRAGWKSDIVVVIAGTEDKDIVSGDFTTIAIPDSLGGFAGLQPVISGDLAVDTDYVLLLHDTMEALPDFIDRLSNIEAGVSYDFIQAHYEVGLWSADFLRGLKELEGFELNQGSVANLMSMFKGLFKLWRKGQEARPLKSKDVYGSGVRRSVQELPEIGFKKYLGSRASGGRP